MIPDQDVAALMNQGAKTQAAKGELMSDKNPSEDAVALALVDRHDEFRFVAKWHRWIKWDGKRWREDSTASVFACIREMVRTISVARNCERTTANASFVAGVERLARTDQRIVIVPEQLDADPWTLNTQGGIVDLRTGTVRAHDPAAYCTRIAGAAVDPTHGGALWSEFLCGVTQGDDDLSRYLQRVAGYGATGATTEDILVYLFGIGANGKSSFAEAVASALGDYAMVFAPEVLMEAKGERHPTELAQFRGVRLAVTSEPSSSATWNDSRVKQLTGDAVISARVMRGDPFEFPRTHKTLVVGNHMPRLSAVTHAIRRRIQMVPFRAVFETSPGEGMRERLRNEAGGAILAWIVDGARAWASEGTAPPESVRALTAEYLSDQDEFGQWLAERCERDAHGSERSSDLHRNFAEWCEAQGGRPKSNMALSQYLVSAGFERWSTMVGRVFRGIRLKAP